MTCKTGRGDSSFSAVTVSCCWIVKGMSSNAKVYASPSPATDGRLAASARHAQTHMHARLIRLAWHSLASAPDMAHTARKVADVNSACVVQAPHVEGMHSARRTFPGLANTYERMVITSHSKIKRQYLSLGIESMRISGSLTSLPCSCAPMAGTAALALNTHPCQ